MSVYEYGFTGTASGRLCRLGLEEEHEPSVGWLSMSHVPWWWDPGQPWDKGLACQEGATVGECSLKLAEQLAGVELGVTRKECWRESCEDEGTMEHEFDRLVWQKIKRMVN